ncbi:hypothetical protein JL721_11690 [Aureococcus anophagefferens]|nr:hypothetical protein JL721_11690 [Aureococcus anophagefferens]
MKLTLALATGAAASGNMNGPYTVSSGAGKTGVAFNSDYASKGHEYFDVYSPELATQYARRRRAAATIPRDAIAADHGEHPGPAASSDSGPRAASQAITGYEMDMVMVSPLDAPGQHPENDVSVPINWAYNHHYEAWMTGKYSELRKIEHPDPADLTFHGSPKTLELVEADGARDALGDVPSSQWFSEGNGGESRKSFHGYPDGYAQLIGSPDAWHIEPMQIDTRNRESGRSHLKAGSPYSGVLECPCTSRYGGSVEYYGEAAGTKAGGALCEAGGKNCHQFNATPRCAGPWNGEPSASGGELLAMGNPTFRFWFQEYEPATATAKASHSDLPRYYYLTEQNAGEYDIPAFRARRPGDPGMPGWPISTSSADLHLTPGTSCVGDCPGGPDCECEHTITSHFDVSVYGEGDVAADKFDEVGYVALPPCLWGSKDEGLEPPVFLGEDTPMFSITHTWNTHVGHTGQMASWQMRGVPFAATA